MYVEVDVAVVGARLAGLSAAREIAAAGRSLRVLEVGDRVGGRTVGHTLANGFTVEMGRQWIGMTQTEVLRLIGELGLETFPTYDSGAGVAGDGAIHRYQDATLGLPERSLAEIGHLQQLLEGLTAGVPLASPWSATDAGELDHQTFDSWLTSNTDDPDALPFYRFVASSSFRRRPPRSRSCTSCSTSRPGAEFDILIATTGGAQELRVVGGSHRISERLAEELGHEVVSLGVTVRANAEDAESVAVIHEGGEVTARHVIVALPPTLAGRLPYAPPLSASRDGLTQQMPMGTVIKVQAAYETPFGGRRG